MHRLLAAATVAGVLSTAVASPAAFAGGDRPDTLRAARHEPASPEGVWLAEALGSASDRDYFRFRMAKPGHALVTLGRLPGNYALDLFRSDGTLVAGADRSGRRFEQLYVALPAGDYFARVSSSHRVNPDRDYLLQFRSLPEAVVFAEFKDVARGNGIDVRGELLNNTAHRVQVDRLHVRYFDKKGNVVGSTDVGIRPGPIASRHRAEFEIKRSDAQIPAGTASYRIRVVAAHTHTPVQHGVTVTAATRQALSNSVRRYRGSVTNTTDHTLRNVWVTVIEYDNRGVANAFGFARVASLAPGATAAYALRVRYPAAPNATRDYATVYG